MTFHSILFERPEDSIKDDPVQEPAFFVDLNLDQIKQGAVKDYRVKSSNRPDMNHIEEKVLDFVAKLYPEIFVNIDNYCANTRTYLDTTIAVFDREIQFYIAYLEHAEMFKQ